MTRPSRIVVIGVLALCAPACQWSTLRTVSATTPQQVPDTTCRPPGVAAGGDNRIRAECPDVVPVRQESDVWCWAACAQMVLAAQGVDCSQSEIAARIHGHANGRADAAEPAAYYEIMLALNADQEWIPFEHWITVYLAARAGGLDTALEYREGLLHALRVLTPNSDVIVSSLLDRSPLVVVLHEEAFGAQALEHAYVLHGATYAVEEHSFWTGLAQLATELANAIAGRTLLAEDDLPKHYSLHSVDLIDPYTGTSATYEASEFTSRVRLVLSRTRSRELLESLRSVVAARPG